MVNFNTMFYGTNDQNASSKKQVHNFVRNSHHCSQIKFFNLPAIFHHTLKNKAQFNNLTL